MEHTQEVRRVVYMIEEYDADLNNTKADVYETFREAWANLKGRSRPVLFEHIMYGTDDGECFTVEGDEFRAIWKSLAYNRAWTAWWRREVVEFEELS